MFQAAVFVDYARIQAADAVSVAVSNIGSVLGQTLIDGQAARAALGQLPTLVVLDNLEALAADALKELLDAAKGWSEAGLSRVLLTTRTPEFGHPDYRVEGTLIHRRIVLDGLGSKKAPDDALEWFAELSKLPPAPRLAPPRREELIDLFDRVRFHPLSILVLAAQLKTRKPDELVHRLGQLLGGGSSSQAATTEATLPELVASLQLSVDRLDETARQVLPRLGVFQGGAFEDDLLAITEVGEEVWPGLGRQLEAAALIQAEAIPGVRPPFFRFHPTLGPMLWEQLGADDRARLTDAHRQRYHGLANYLYNQDDKNPHFARAIALRELPNLLHAVEAAFSAQDPGAVDFADSVTKFLNTFGLRRESEQLTARAQAASGDEGSQTWLVAQSNRGLQLLENGRAAEAAQVFQAILTKLGEAPSHRRAVTLSSLGRCFRFGGRPDLAAEPYREGLAVAAQLEQSDSVKRLQGALRMGLADVLVDSGQYAEARKEYEASLAILEEIGDLRDKGAVLGQLGTLAMRERKLEEAQTRHRAALELFQRLREPAMEGVASHQLGRVFQEAEQWDEAERHFREAARLKEENGLIGGPNGAATTWNELANVSMNDGKPEAAESWYRKAIDGGQAHGDLLPVSRALNNLADLLQAQPGRLAEARQLAEEALTLKRTIDAGPAEIWKTYTILSMIADKEAELTPDRQRGVELQSEAREHRRLGREAKRKFPGTRHELKKRLPLTLATVLATQDPAQHGELASALSRYSDPVWNRLVGSIHRIVGGERDPEALGVDSDLDPQDSLILGIILAAMADPSTLSDLLPEAPEE
jgi:tetratricopeptide (TPR) repeat protein